jgi:4,4'-diaponeurosporenoate glycosyltransferase
MSTAILLLVLRGSMWPAIAVLYALNVLQIAWYARQLGTFRWSTALFYPIALSFYFVVFGQSLWRQRLGKSVTWKGRQLWS